MQSLSVQIPGQLIDDIVRAEIVRSLGNKEALVAAVVKQAMAKGASSYSKSVFQEEVEESIRDAATEIFKEWLAENKATVREALIKHLKDNRGKVIAQLVDSLCENIGTHGVHVEMKLKNIQ